MGIEQFTDEIKGLATGIAEMRALAEAGDTKATAAVAEMSEKFARLEARLSDIEIKRQRQEEAKAAAPQPRMSIGQALTSSKAYKTFAKGNRLSMDEPVYVDGMIDNIKSRGNVPVSIKAGTEHSTTAPTTIVPIVPTHIVPGFVEVPTRPRSLLDMLGSMPSTSGTIEYVQEDGFYGLATALNGALLVGAVSAVVEDIEGFFANTSIPQKVTLSYGLAAQEDVLVLTVTAATKTITFAATANAHANGAEVIAEDFDFTEELALRPLGTIKYSDKSASGKILGVGIAISKQLAKDAPALTRYLDRRMPRQLEVELERWLLYGNGSTQIQGLLTHPDVQTLTGAGVKLDDLRKAITLVDLAFFPTTGVLMHPTDLQDIDLAKDTTNQYIRFRTNGMTWDVPVVKSAVIEYKHAVLGAFDIAATYWTMGATTINIYDQHSDWALKGKLLVLAEVRSALTVERPKSIVHITFV